MTPLIPRLVMYGHDLTYVLESTSACHGVSCADIMSERRHKRTVEARRDLCQRLRKLGLTFSEVGQLIGRDHSTVVHACREDAA